MENQLSTDIQLKLTYGSELITRELYRLMIVPEVSGLGCPSV